VERFSTKVKKEDCFKKEKTPLRFCSTRIIEKALQRLEDGRRKTEVKGLD